VSYVVGIVEYYVAGAVYSRDIRRALRDGAGIS